MKKLIYATVISVVSVLSGCSMYSAPWAENPYKAAPINKEARVYQPSQTPVNQNVGGFKTVKKAPVLDAKSNTNKSIQATVTPTKKASIVKEKVIVVAKPVNNTVPNVTSQLVVEKPINKEVMIIPIE